MTYKDISIAQKEHSFTSSDTITNITGENESVESIHSDNEITCVKTGHKCSSILNDITIDAEIWQCIGPKPVIYKEHSRYNSTRKYSVLQRGWTDVISKLCWAKTKIPCVYTFKRAKVYESESDTYITIFGKCKDCGAPFRAHCLKKPEVRNSLQLFVKTIDTRGIPHEKKSFEGYRKG